MKKRMFLRIALAALLSVGLYAFAAPTPAAHAAPPTSHTIIRMSGTFADSGFSITQGDVTDFVEVAASPDGFQGLISGPAVMVYIVECKQVTEENADCAAFGGVDPVPGLQIPNKLTSVTLPEMTVPVSPVDEFGNPSGPPAFDVSVALTWTGVGSITSSHSVSHYRVAHTFIETSRFKGLSRDATVTGAVSYPSPLLGPITLTGADSVFAILMSQGSMIITIQR